MAKKSVPPNVMKKAKKRRVIKQAIRSAHFRSFIFSISIWICISLWGRFVHKGGDFAHSFSFLIPFIHFFAFEWIFARRLMKYYEPKGRSGDTWTDDGINAVNMARGAPLGLGYVASTPSSTSSSSYH